jgi:hypothetical protein
MESYRARFLTHGGRVFGTEDFEADTDQHAIEYARKMFSTSIGKGHEIWQGERRIHTEIYPSLDWSV